MADRIIISIVSGIVIFGLTMLVIGFITLAQMVQWPPWTVVAIGLGVAAAIAVFVIDAKWRKR